jgi:hypothetical protein
MPTYQKLFLLFYSRFIVESTGLNDLIVNIELEPGSLVHGFLDTLLGYETQDEYGTRLADTMSTILGLQVGMRVPVGVKAKDGY